MSEGFARDLDDHVRTEFPLLRDLLRKRRAGDTLPSRRERESADGRAPESEDVN